MVDQSLVSPVEVSAMAAFVVQAMPCTKPVRL